MTREEAIKRAIESAKCRIYKSNFDLEGKLSARHQRTAENQKELMEITVEALEKSLGNDINVGSKWIPCSERLPSENGKYLATGIKGSVYIAEFSKGVINGKHVSLWCRSGGHYCNVIAWMELPPAYEGE